MTWEPKDRNFSNEELDEALLWLDENAPTKVKDTLRELVEHIEHLAEGLKEQQSKAETKLDQVIELRRTLKEKYEEIFQDAFPE